MHRETQQAKVKARNVIRMNFHRVVFMEKTNVTFWLPCFFYAPKPWRTAPFQPACIVVSSLQVEYGTRGAGRRVFISASLKVQDLLQGAVALFRPRIVPPLYCSDLVFVRPPISCRRATARGVWGGLTPNHRAEKPLTLTLNLTSQAAEPHP